LGSLHKTNARTTRRAAAIANDRALRELTADHGNLVE
jgi:hypothetical protein